MTDIIRVGVTVDPDVMRAALIEDIYSGAGIPSTVGFTTSTLNTTDPLVSFSITPSNLLQYDAHTVVAKDNSSTDASTAKVGVWRPTALTSNNKLVIQLAGHGLFLDELNPGIDNHTHGNLVQELVQAGYTVAFVEMAQNGGNAGEHDLNPPPTASLNPLRYFMQAPIITLNTLIPEGYDNIYGCGQSGGGWGLVLLCAIDTRIQIGDSNNGYLALYMDTVPGRDYEQFLPMGRNLSALAGLDYTDLAALSCYPYRHHIQSNGTLDAYFPQSIYNAFDPYEDEVTSVATSFGGIYELQWDVTNTHHYTAARRAAIIALFDAGPIEQPATTSLYGGWGAGLNAKHRRHTPGQPRKLSELDPKPVAEVLEIEPAAQVLPALESIRDGAFAIADKRAADALALRTAKQQRENNWIMLD